MYNVCSKITHSSDVDSETCVADIKVIQSFNFKKTFFSFYLTVTTVYIYESANGQVHYNYYGTKAINMTNIRSRKFLSVLLQITSTFPFLS